MRWICTVGAALAVAGAVLSGLPAAAGAGEARGNTEGRYDWSGIYYGTSVGYAALDATAKDLRQPAGGYFTKGGPATGAGFTFSADGAIAGDHIGIQQQAGPWVAGIEVTGLGAYVQTTITSPYYPATDRESLTLGPIVAGVVRLGYAHGRLLAYAKAGMAGAQLDFHAVDDSTAIAYRRSSWHSGVAAGGGFEYAALNWLRVGLDYTYMDLDANTKTATNSAGGSETYRLAPNGLHAVTLRLSLPLGRRAEGSEEALK